MQPQPEGAVRDMRVAGGATPSTVNRITAVVWETIESLLIVAEWPRDATRSPAAAVERVGRASLQQLHHRDGVERYVADLISAVRHRPQCVDETRRCVEADAVGQPAIAVW